MNGCGRTTGSVDSSSRALTEATSSPLATETRGELESELESSARAAPQRIPSGVNYPPGGRSWDLSSWSCRH